MSVAALIGTHRTITVALVVIALLSGCAPESSKKGKPIRPEKSVAALNYSRGSVKEAANSEFVKLIRSTTKAGQEGYFRNVECAAALQGAVKRAEQQISTSDPRIPALRQAVALFRERAIALGEKAGFSRRRVLTEISRVGRAEGERELDTIQRQAQQSVLCLNELL